MIIISQDNKTIVMQCQTLKVQSYNSIGTIIATVNGENIELGTFYQKGKAQMVFDEILCLIRNKETDIYYVPANVYIIKTTRRTEWDEPIYKICRKIGDEEAIELAEAREYVAVRLIYDTCSYHKLSNVHANKAADIVKSFET